MTKVIMRLEKARQAIWDFQPQRSAGLCGHLKRGLAFACCVSREADVLARFFGSISRDCYRGAGEAE
jgi:hypothetical protein